MKKPDTTTLILLLILLFLLLRKKATAQTAAGASPARLGSSGGTGSSTSSKPTFLQQIFGKNPLAPTTTAPAKPSAGTSAGLGPSAGTSRPPSTATSTGWRPPTRYPLNLLPSAPLTNTIASIPPPFYDLPTMNYPGFTEMPTIPSDTSGLFVTPDDPMPIHQSESNNIFDSSGNLIGNTGGMLQYEAPPEYDIPTMNYPGPTTPPDVGYQTTDTTQLGSISYLPTDTSGGDIFASAGGYSYSNTPSTADNSSYGLDTYSEFSDE